MTMGILVVLGSILGILVINYFTKERKSVIEYYLTKQKSGVWPKKFYALQTGQLKSIFSFIVTVIILLWAVFILSSGQYSETTQKFASGAIGNIIGFWLSKA